MHTTPQPDPDDLDPDSTKPRPPVSEGEAAAYSGMSPGYLRVLRRRGAGPAYLRFGRSIRYQLADLDAWILRHRINPEEGRLTARR